MSTRRAAVLAVPALVPLSMTVVFRGLAMRFPPSAAYNLSFAVYWLGWGGVFPLWVLRPRGVLRALTSARRASPSELALLLLPVAGAIYSELVPNRRAIDPAVAATMVSTGVLNAVAEELLWRGVFLQQFPDDLRRGILWPLAGFALWHLAPQVVLPSRFGRWRFVLGAALVGSASAFSAWRNNGGLRNCLVPHAATDACGVTAAKFRLGR